MAATKKPRKRPAAKRRAKHNGAKDKGGRPEIHIDLVELEKLGGLQCTHEDAAAWFGCSPDTIERRLTDESRPEFREAWECGRGKGRVSLRRSQFELAKKSATMAIWLGKQLLGQKDEAHLTVNQRHDVTDFSNDDLLGILHADSGRGGNGAAGKANGGGKPGRIH